jgi:hypothetical protein
VKLKYEAEFKAKLTINFPFDIVDYYYIITEIDIFKFRFKKNINIYTEIIKVMDNIAIHILRHVYLLYY